MGNVVSRTLTQGSQPRFCVSVFLRSVAFLLGQTVSTLVIGSIALLATPVVPYRLRYRIVNQWTRFNLWWLGVTCRLHHRVAGLDNIPAKPTIILCKHQSAWETIALQLYFFPQVWVLKRELLLVPFFGWGLATMRPIAIDRRAKQSAMEQILSQGRQRLDSGHWVVVFPEGTRVKPGVRKRYMLGGASLAAATGYPVVPVAHNSGDFWPRNSFLKFPGVIDMVVGDPIDSTNKSAAEINQLAEHWIENTVERLRRSNGHGET